MNFKSVVFVLSLYKKGVTEDLVKDALAVVNSQLQTARGLRPEGKEKRASIWGKINEVNRDLIEGDATKSIKELIHQLESW